MIVVMQATLPLSSAGSWVASLSQRLWRINRSHAVGKALQAILIPQVIFSFYVGNHDGSAAAGCEAPCSVKLRPDAKKECSATNTIPAKIEVETCAAPSHFASRLNSDARNHQD